MKRIVVIDNRATNTESRLLWLMLLSGAVLVALLWTTAASGATAYYSIEGTFTNGSETQSFLLNTDAAINSTETFSLRTWHYSGTPVGQTNAAGDVIPGGGFDPILRLYAGETLTAVDDDINRSLSNYDAELTWRSADYSPPEIELHTPFRSGDYRLDLRALSGGGSHWAVDLVGPADTLTLTGVASQNSTLTSLKFGSSDVLSTASIAIGDSQALVMSGHLVVGKSGRGDLEVSGGAIVSGDAWLGFDNGCLGIVTLENSALWSANTVQLGSLGDAGLLVDSHSQAEFYGDVFLAYYYTSNSTVTITGPGSLMTAHADLEIGDGGYGGLHITDHGELDSRGVGTLGRDVVGDDSTAHGEVTVAGAGALWQTDKLIVGNYGQGTVDVTGGGKIATTGNAYIGYTADGDHSHVTLTGAAPDDTPSTWQVSGDLYIAGNESGPSLADQTHLTINPGGLVEVTGTTNLWDSGWLELHGGTLRTGALGTSEGQSDWTSGTLELTNSGLVLDGRSGRVGTIDAGKSLLLSSPHPDDELVIGDTATANLSVTAGGSIISKSAVMVAKQPGSIGELHVSGADASVSIQAPFYVGGGKTAYGGTAVLTVDNGGLLETVGETLVYSDSTVAISGYGSLWRAGPIALGAPAPPTTAPLTLADQARIESGDVQIGPALGTGSAIVDGYVDGIGLPATWDIDGSLNIGLFDYARGDFTVQRAGRVNVSESINIAWYGTLQLLGGQITTNSFIVNPGGTFTHTDGTLIVDRGQFTIEGGDLSVDSTTGTPTVRLQNGAAGSVEAPRGATHPGGWITIGGDGDGRLEVVSGATLTSGGGRIATWTATYPGVGTGHVLVQGEGSRWDITAENGMGGVWTPSLYVGANGAGTLEIRDRGQVVAAVAAGIGGTYLSASEGLGGPGTAIVDGPGSLFRVTEKVPGYGLGYLQVGATDPTTGSSGSLTVTNSGRVDVEGTFTVLDAGDVRLASGGKINAGSFNVEPGGTFTHEDGTLTVDGGTFDPGVGAGAYVITGVSSTDRPKVVLTNGAHSVLPNLLIVGAANYGELAIESGATLSAGNVRTSDAWPTPASSKISVRGDGSRLDVTAISTDGAALKLGNTGTSELVISDGGQVNVQQGGVSLGCCLIGDQGGGGDITIEGEHSRLDAAYATLIAFGRSSRVSVRDHGAMQVVDASIWAARAYPIQVEVANGGQFDVATTLAIFGSTSATARIDVGGGAAGTAAIGVGGGLYVGGTSTQSVEGAAIVRIASGGFLDAGNVKVWQPGTLELDNGIVSSDSVELAGGALRGTGSLILVPPNALHNAGLIAPGTSAGVVNLASGNYVQDAAATLAIEIGGRYSSQYDSLRIVSGNATLAGTLNVSLIDPAGGSNIFMPTAGDAFDILDWNSRIGTFDTLLLPPLTPGLMWNAAQLYTAGILKVVVAGDYNGNGIVDAADYTVWRDTLGSTIDLRANGDDKGASAGRIDQADYLAWKSHFGLTAGSGAATSIGVPEPTIILLGLLCAACLVMRRPTHAPLRIACFTNTALITVLPLTFIHSPVLADTFGSGANRFDIEFVTVNDPDNLDYSGTTSNWYSPYGAVEYVFRVAGAEEPQCLCPTIVTQPQSQTVTVGSDITLLFEVTGTEPLMYQWNKDSKSIPGATDPTYSLFDVQFVDAGDYQAMSVNPCGVALSDIASLTVIPLPFAGDYNLNGVVDAADYTVWRDTLGSTTDLRANGDDIGASAGVIDGADYGIWKSHFSEVAVSRSGAVPEPATLPLLIVGLWNLALHAKRSRRVLD